MTSRFPLPLPCMASFAATAALVVVLAGPAAAESVCGDVNATASVTSTDALLVLRKAVGQEVSGMLCVQESQLGDPDDYNGTVNVPQDYLLGQKIHIDRTSFVTHVGVITRAGGTKGRFNVYTDDNGSPGVLVAGTYYVDVKLGVQKIPVTTEKNLLPGDYWIMVRYNAMTQVAGNPTAGSSAVIKYKYQTSEGAPGTFGEAQEYTGERLNYWLEVEN